MANEHLGSAEDALFEALKGPSHAKLSPEMLEMMGKEAANRFLDKGIPLNESISKLAASHDDISHDQVKRVVEFANTAVYLKKHDNSKLAGASSSYPQFELADAGRIIQDLSDGARSTVTTKTDLDYARLPTKSKTASAKTDFNLDALVDLFAPKNPELDQYTKEAAIQDLMDTKNALESLKENLENSYYPMTHSLESIKEEYYDMTKRHVLDGGSFSDILATARSTGAEDAKIASVISPVAQRLIKEKVASVDQLKVATRNLEKVAHRVVNSSHPFVTSFAAILTLQEEMAKTAEALNEVDTELGRVKSFIKETFRAK